MKAFVITIKDLPQSVKAAERCIASAAKQDLHVEMFDAYTPHNCDLKQVMNKLKIIPQGLQEKFSRPANATAAFISHFRLWQKCIDSNEETLIFEHDAVVVDKIPSVVYQGCISFGKPSYGRFNTPPLLGVNKLTSKRYFPGAHAYLVKPQAAEIFVEQGRLFARPTDVFLNIDTFPFLQEYYPWPVECRDTFTTIQNQRGCLAKHSYQKDPKQFKVI